MPLTIEIIPDPEQGGFTAPVAGYSRLWRRGNGRRSNQRILKEAIRGYIETFGLDDARDRISKPALRTIDLDLAELIRG